mmetsp:Transcript_112962/g.326342  ORF Transcript_112962/g.326342 Transcript_112962/m.326342 type:complete len:254 (-) Transcript_112962:808-1569(-)
MASAPPSRRCAAARASNCLSRQVSGRRAPACGPSPSSAPQSGAAALVPSPAPRRHGSRRRHAGPRSAPPGTAARRRGRRRGARPRATSSGRSWPPPAHANWGSHPASTSRRSLRPRGRRPPRPRPRARSRRRPPGLPRWCPTTPPSRGGGPRRSGRQPSSARAPHHCSASSGGRSPWSPRRQRRAPSPRVASCAPAATARRPNTREPRTGRARRQGLRCSVASGDVPRTSASNSKVCEAQRAGPRRCLCPRRN